MRIPVGPTNAPTDWALIDPDDYARLSGHRWYLSGGGYAFRTARGRSFFMHREIAAAAKGLCVHHVNGDKLDNRRANLEITTQAKHISEHARVERARLSALAWPMRRKGMTKTEIAAELGVSRAHVNALLPGESDVTRQVWPRERCVEAIRAVSESLGRTPKQSDFTSEYPDRPHWNTLYRRFPGGFGEALIEAGFEPRPTAWKHRRVAA